MNKVIDNTPINLRAFARMALTSCDAVNNEEEMTNLLESARKDLEKADPLQQPLWYMTLVRIYTKKSSDTAPEVFFQAVTAINRVAKERKDECPTSTTTPTVLSNQILLDQYKLPVSVMDADEPGVLHAISTIQPADIRAALRLNLLKAILEQQLIEKTRKSTRTSLSMKVFITGGTGVIGRRLIPLLEAGHEVVAPRHAELDLEDAAAVISALEGVNAVYHLATRIVTAREQATLRSGLRTTACAGSSQTSWWMSRSNRGVQAIIYPSITFLYPASGPADEVHTLGHTDDRGATVRRRSPRGAVQRFDGDGRRGVIVRFGLFWGPDAATTSPDDRFGATIHLDDAASAMVAALTLPSGIYNAVSDGQRISNAKLKQASAWRPRY